MLTNVFFSPSLDEQFSVSDLLSSLTAGFPELEWNQVDNVIDAELAFFSTSDDKHPQNKCLVLSDRSATDICGFVIAEMLDKGIVLPTDLGKKILLGQIEKEQGKFAKVKQSTPLLLTGQRTPPAEIATDKVEIAAFAIHPPTMERHLPAVKGVCDRRAVRSLQRAVDNYRPLQCAVSDEEVQSEYPDLPRNGAELNERIAAIRPKLDALGIVPAPSDMSYSQINLGTPFPGGANRRASGLTPPSRAYEECASHIADIMLLGAARELKRLGEEEFAKLNVRVGVKKGNYQGAPLSTTSHTVRQTAWAIMLDAPEGIFFFGKYNFPTLSGFRRQANSGKCRVSFILSDEPWHLLRSHVLDGEYLQGKKIAHYDSFSSISSPEFVTDSGVIGARCRVIENVWSPQNDALLPVPAYIAKFKDKHYKYMFQQDMDIMSRFVPESPQFRQYWLDAYENEIWVRECAAERGCNTAEELITKMVELGEYIIAGDVENFDGYTTWELILPFFARLVSKDVLHMLDKLWNADKIGVYTDHTGQITYYYISCQTEDWMDADTKRLVEQTLSDMSHVASGLGVTAQCGRGVVPTVMMEITALAFSADKPDIMDYLKMLPSSEESYHSPLGTVLNSAGDDHNLCSLAIWLLTGIHPKQARERFLETMEQYTTLKITREVPAMNAGFFFHEDEEGRLIAVSLSESRCWGNTVNPEYPRSAIGLFHSLMGYINSAVGTPSEHRMVQIAELVACDLYGFKSLEDLERIANWEEAVLAHEATALPPLERIALMLDVPPNDLEWKFEFDELVELGVPTDLLNEFRRPIPEALTLNPLKFLNGDSIRELASNL
jgi:hypothetical protein